MWSRPATLASSMSPTPYRSGSSSGRSSPRPAPHWRYSPPSAIALSSPIETATLWDLEADHRRHAEIKNAIRDLKYGVGLNHLPSGCFPANAGWLAIQAMAHLPLANPGWTTRTGLGEPVATTKTLRRRLFSLAGRLTRKARRITLYFPQGWPWQNQFSRALARLRALPLPS